MRRLALGLAVALGLALTGCGISAEDAPRNVIATEQPIDLRPAREPVVADDPNPSGPDVFFLLVEEEVEKVEPVGRAIDADPRRLLDALMQGPTEEERNEGVNTAIPTNTRVLRAELNRGIGTLDVDLSAEFLTQEGTAVGTAVAQIVFTATEAPGVQRVVISVDGESYEWAFDDRTFPEGTAMSRRDFPALDPTEYVEPFEPPRTRPTTTSPSPGAET